jgi:hypothetical protein
MEFDNSLSRIVVDICTLDCESISDPYLQRAAKSLGKSDWVSVSIKLAHALRHDELVIEGDSELGTKLHNLIDNVPALEGIFLRSYRAIWSDLTADEKQSIIPILDKLRPSRAID